MITSGGNRNPMKPDCGDGPRRGWRRIGTVCSTSPSTDATDPLQPGRRLGSVAGRVLLRPTRSIPNCAGFDAVVRPNLGPDCAPGCHFILDGSLSVVCTHARVGPTAHCGRGSW